MVRTAYVAETLRYVTNIQEKSSKQIDFLAW